MPGPTPMRIDKILVRVGMFELEDRVERYAVAAITGSQ
jgi:hypothetical protein